MKIPKKRLEQAVARFRDQFGDQPTRAIGEVLPQALIDEALEQEVGRYRERVYPPLTTLGLFIGQALSPDGACQDAVARARSERCARGEAGCSLNTGPYCKARQRLPRRLVERLAVGAGEALERRTPRQWRWRGRSVKLLDGTTVSMPDTAANQAVYPQSGAQKPGLGFPLLMLVGLISLSTGAVLRWALGPCRGKHTSEQALFRTLMPTLEPADVVLVDRYHCSYFTIALLRERGVDILTVQHPRRRTDFDCGQRLGQADQLVQWLRPKRPNWMDAETYARMPEQLNVRQTRVAKRILVTTLTDARSISASELDALYSRRWQIEVDLRSIKAEMGMDVLRSKSPEMVDKEIAVYLLAYNLVCALMTRAGAASGVLARALSFKGTVQLLLAFQQHLRHNAVRQVKRITAHLLGAISELKLRARPGRVEPHAIKRRPKNHRLLIIPRAAAREIIVSARAKTA